MALIEFNLDAFAAIGKIAETLIAIIQAIDRRRAALEKRSPELAAELDRLELNAFRRFDDVMEAWHKLFFPDKPVPEVKK